MNGGRILALILFACFAGAAVMHYSSDMLRCLQQGKKTHFVVLTAPMAYVEYDPQEKKAAVKFAQVLNKEQDLAAKLEAAGAAFSIDGDFRYVEPAENNSWLDFWESAVFCMQNWRNKPALVFSYIKNYLVLRAEKRTNLSPAEFYVLSSYLARFGVVDIQLAPLPAEPKDQKNKRLRQKDIKQTAKAPIAAALPEETVFMPEKPLRIAVLNASGKSDLARLVRRYVLKMNTDKHMAVDVFKFSNYGSETAKTKIINYGGDTKQIAALIEYLGINSAEVYTGKPSDSQLIDAELILGRDFDEASVK